MQYYYRKWDGEVDQHEAEFVTTMKLIIFLISQHYLCEEQVVYVICL